MSSCDNFSITTFYNTEDGVVLLYKRRGTPSDRDEVQIQSFLPLTDESKQLLSMIHPDLNMNVLEEALLAWERERLWASCDDPYCVWSEAWSWH